MKKFIHDSLTSVTMVLAFAVIPALAVFVYFRERCKLPLLRILARLYGYVGRSVEKNFG